MQRNLHVVDRAIELKPSLARVAGDEESLPEITVPSTTSAPALRLVRDDEPAHAAKSPHPRRLDPEEERDLARAWHQDQSTAARNKLIESHIGLVVAIARGLANRGVALEDLIAEGNIGLIRAVDKYNPELGFRLATFAFQHIRHAMVALIAANSPRGRLRHDARRKLAQWETAVACINATKGSPPDDIEVAAHLGWTPADVASARRLQAMTSQWAQRLAMEAQADARQNESDQIQGVFDRGSSSAREQIAPLLAMLNPREREAVELLYGLNRAERLSVPAAARAMGCTPGELVRLRTAAHTKMYRHRHLITHESA